MKKIIIALGCCLIVLSGCFFKRDTMEDINIYTTIYPLNYLINSLYGSNSKIYSIYPSGVDVDDYKLSDKKINDNQINISQTLKISFNSNQEYLEIKSKIKSHQILQIHKIISLNSIAG